MPFKPGKLHPGYKHGHFIRGQRWSEAAERAEETGVDCLGRRYVATRIDHRILDDVILDHVSRREPRSSMELHKRVVDDYGSVGIRVLYRHLVKLRKSGAIKIAKRRSTGLLAQLFYVRGK